MTDDHAPTDRPGRRCTRRSAATCWPTATTWCSTSSKSQGRRLYDARSGRWTCSTCSRSSPRCRWGSTTRGCRTRRSWRSSRAPRSPTRPTPTSTRSSWPSSWTPSAASPCRAYLPHVFFVAGGTLGVENALKAAFDWKVRRNFRKGVPRGEGPPGHPLPRGLPRPLGLHAVDDQHRRPAQAPVLPQVRLAAHRQPRRCASRSTRPSSSAWQQVERQAIAQIKQAFRRARGRHRRAHHRADPGRGRRQPLPPASSCARCADLAHENDALFIFDEVQTRRRPHRPHLGAPALRRRARPARLRQEDAGVRHDGRARASTRSPRTSSRCRAASTRPGAATWWTWCARSATSRSSRRRSWSSTRASRARTC